MRWALAVAVPVVLPACGRETPASRSRARTFDVAADRGWQETGVSIEARRPCTVRFVAGRISDRDTTILDGNGSDYICGSPECCEPLPHARRGALVGQVASETFLVGNGGSFTTSSDGVLTLRINDCDDGLFDDTGALQIEIAP